VSGAESTYSAEFHSGLRATLTVSLKGFRCEWSPDLPRSLKAADRDALLTAYRAWRDQCLSDFARAHGLSIHSIRTAGGDAIAFFDQESAS
jgi:hypothetical protein